MSALILTARHGKPVKLGDLSYSELLFHIEKELAAFERVSTGAAPAKSSDDRSVLSRLVSQWRSANAAPSIRNLPPDEILARIDKALATIQSPAGSSGVRP